jgi:hypothetical protein
VTGTALRDHPDRSGLYLFLRFLQIQIFVVSALENGLIFSNCA